MHDTEPSYEGHLKLKCLVKCTELSERRIRNDLWGTEMFLWYLTKLGQIQDDLCRPIAIARTSQLTGSTYYEGEKTVPRPFSIFTLFEKSRTRVVSQFTVSVPENHNDRAALEQIHQDLLEFETWLNAWQNADEYEEN
jgi:hypothetical protein